MVYRMLMVNLLLTHWSYHRLALGIWIICIADAGVKSTIFINHLIKSMALYNTALILFSLVHTKLVCNTSLHVPTQITERLKTGNFDKTFWIIRYQYVSKQFSVRRSRLYSVGIQFRSGQVTSSPRGDDVSKLSKSVCSALEPVQTQLYLVPTMPNSVLTSS